MFTPDAVRYVAVRCSAKVRYAATEMLGVGLKGLNVHNDLPRCTHSLFVPAICEHLPLKYELACRQTFFIDNCLKSVYSVVKFVARNGVYFSHMYSAIGRSD